ncbi:MAG: hypothetical protein ACOYN0_02980 [Phycisphaerales bacterium]
MKAATGVDLLRSLGSGVLPPGVEGRGTKSEALDRLGFAELLSKARSGAVQSGLSVTVAGSAGVTLSEGQLERLAKAADLAESQGATRAVVFMDGMALRMDVASRTVLGEVDLSRGGVVTELDSVISIPGNEAGATSEPQVVPVPDRGVLGLSPAALAARGQAQG